MSKGIASRNSLKALAHPVQQFLAAWGAREKPSAPKLPPRSAASRVAAPQGGGGGLGRPGAATLDATGHAELPAPYELAALRGEAVLRTRFFGAFMARLPVELDAAQQLAAWRSLVEDGGHITAWVQRLGIAKALRREALVPLSAHQEARKLYTLLLDALSQQAPELLPWAVEGYFWHCWKQQFPDAPATAPADKGKTSAEVQRERLLRALRRQHGNAVEIKESFTQTDEAVRFGLLWRTGPHAPWQTLLAEVDRPLLKTARAVAYSEAAERLAAHASA